MPISMTKTNGHEEGAAVSSVTLLAFCGAVHQDERMVGCQIAQVGQPRSRPRR